MSKKRFNNIYDDITSFHNLRWAYDKSIKGKNKYSADAMVFAKNETYNLHVLQKELKEQAYKPSGYIRFKVYEPKERIIDAPKQVDKIVHLAADRILKAVYQPAFIYDSYACLDNKGTHKAVDRVSQFMRKSHWEYREDAYIIKLDVSKFFYSIDRDILKQLLRKKIKCKRTLWLLDTIVDSANEIDLLGLPLGNTTSQILANVYMNELDQYCKRVLQIKYYVRYADDVIAIVKNKEQAIINLEHMEAFLQNELHLVANPKKTRIFPLEQGVNAYGYKIYKTHRLLRNESKKKIKRKSKKMRRLLKDGKMKPIKAEQILNSWLGHARFGSSRNFINSLIERNDYICRKGNKLSVNMNKILEVQNDNT